METQATPHPFRSLTATDPTCQDFAKHISRLSTCADGSVALLALLPVADPKMRPAIRFYSRLEMCIKINVCTQPPTPHPNFSSFVYMQAVHQLYVNHRIEKQDRLYMFPKNDSASECIPRRYFLANSTQHNSSH